MSPTCFDTMPRVSDKPYWVYVLWSAVLRRFYIGISDSPEKRLHQHNESGRGWTARGRRWVLVHRELYPDYRTARKRELTLKAHKSGRGFFQATGLDQEKFRGHK